MPFLFRFFVLLGAGLSSFAPVSGFAEQFDVQMLNNDPDNPRSRNLFKPALLHIQPGDSVRFVSVDLGHNSESIKGLVPTGVASWKTDLSKDVVITFDTEGVYGYKCSPHYALGMVGLVVVGSAEVNEEIFKNTKMPRRASKRFKKLFRKLEHTSKKAE